MSLRTSSNDPFVIIRTDLLDHIVHLNPLNNPFTNDGWILVKMKRDSIEFLAWIDRRVNNNYPVLEVNQEESFIARYNLCRSYRDAYLTLKGTN